MELHACHGLWCSGMPVYSLGMVRLMGGRLSQQYSLPLLVACKFLYLNIELLPSSQVLKLD